MKPSQLLEFVKRWKALERQQHDIDCERARWCSDLRAEFSNGSAGDEQFCKWLSVEIGLTFEQQQDCLARAKAFSIIPDQQQWRELGGFVQVRKLIPLDKKERVAVIGAAKQTGYRISTVVRQREAKALTPNAEPPRTPDIVLLAEFVESIDDVPEEVREVARRHIRARSLKVA